MLYSFDAGHSRSSAYRLLVPKGKPFETPSSFSCGVRSPLRSQPVVWPAAQTRPRAGVVHGPERVDPKHVAEGDGLVVAAGREFQRGPAIAEHVVDRRQSRNDRLEVRRPFDLREALLLHERGRRPAGRRQPAVGGLEPQSEIQRQLAGRRPLVLDEHAMVAVPGLERDRDPRRGRGNRHVVGVDRIGTAAAIHGAHAGRRPVRRFLAAVDELVAEPDVMTSGEVARRSSAPDP